MPAEPAFPEMPYLRQDPDALAGDYERLERSLEADDEGALLAAVRGWQALRSRTATMESLGSTRYTLDTTDPEAKAEKRFIDEKEPVFLDRDMRIRRRLLAHPRRPALERAFGRRFLDITAVQVETFDPAISGHLVRQSKLVMEYTDLLASARIPFQGEEHNLAGLARFLQSPDRALRHGAAAARAGFFQAHAAALDRIYDDLVSLRHDMARTLNHPDFIPLGYRNLTRTDYGPAEVARFREEVAAHVVPFAAEMREAQRRRLGLDRLRYWDEAVLDPQGGPKPRGDAAFIVEQTGRMYDELSPETGEFFRMLRRRRLFDLENRKGKAGGGYCTSFPDHRVPFIFTNFNGTKDDVKVMTHEAGHAFQMWMSREQPLLEYLWPTLEACEIHSMSMEFLAWPWMAAFFGEDADRFRRAHLMECLAFLPYGCAVDELQHLVYADPACGPEGRKSFWKAMERKYLPWRDYGDLPFHPSGAFWQGQTHVYGSPFYYIDYVLAGTCALQFWGKAQDGRDAALKDYLAICRPGGSQTFLELVRTGNLRNPFEPGVLADVVRRARSWLGAL